MGYVDYVAIAAIIFAVGGAVFYIVRSKKKGRHCIGCPYSEECGGKMSCGCSAKNED